MSLEKIAQSDLSKLFEDEKLNSILDGIHFCYGDGNYEPGIYIFEGDGKYFYVSVGDRGGVETELESDEVEDVLFPVYADVTFNEATKYAREHREEGKDPRRKIFTAQLEYLRKIDEKYYQKELQEIEEILKDYPYMDQK